MVFFTSILIVVILYYLQMDGLIYITIIALMAELLNILMIHTLTKSIEKKLKSQIQKIGDGYKNRVIKAKKSIKELEEIRLKATQKLYRANLKIKEYEKQLGIKPDGPDKEADDKKKKKIEEKKKKEEKKKDEEKKKEEEPVKRSFDDLPPGSQRRRRRFPR